MCVFPDLAKLLWTVWPKCIITLLTYLLTLTYIYDLMTEQTS